MKLMKLKDRIFHTEALVWTNTKVFKAFSVATVGFLCPLVLGFWSAFEESLAPGKLSLEKHSLWQKCYRHFVRRRIWTHKNAVNSERIMNDLWASLGNCSLISGINPCESLLWWQCLCPSSAKARGYALGTKKMLSPRMDSSEIHPKARLDIATSLLLSIFKVTLLGKKTQDFPAYWQETPRQGECGNLCLCNLCWNTNYYRFTENMHH